MKVRHIRYRKGEYSGVLIKGETPVLPPTSDNHMERAQYLVAMLESSKYGSVQSYDGAGISAGPLHNVAVLPRSMRQGSLWPLLRHLELATSTPRLEELWDAFRAQGWYIGLQGDLRYYNHGNKVPGGAIREVLAPPNGKVPKSGPEWERAREWAIRFHRLFSDERTFKAQREYAITWLITTQKKEEQRVYKDPDLEILKVGADFPLEMDLAMSVYHSHSANGPSMAKKVLGITLNKVTTLDYWDENPSLFAKTLIWFLGKQKYGNWQDDRRGHNRYDRTRKKAMASGLWPAYFFEGIGCLMPENLASTPPKKE